MKARIYKTSNENNEDLQFEEILRQNSIPYEKYSVDEDSIGYLLEGKTDLSFCFYYIYINNLEELLGINRIFEEKLIISECDFKEVGYDLEIEIYDAYRE